LLICEKLINFKSILYYQKIKFQILKKFKKFFFWFFQNSNFFSVLVCPSFEEPFYEMEVFSSDEFPLTVPSVIQSCPNCTCQWETVVSDLPVLINAETGLVQIIGLATSVPSMYRSMVKIKCATEGPSGELVARTVVQIKWHPLPKFEAFEKPIATADTASVGDVLLTLHVQDWFPYALQYDVPTEFQSFLRVEASSGKVILTAVIPEILKPNFNVSISAFEPALQDKPTFWTKISFRVEITSNPTGAKTSTKTLKLNLKKIQSK
jgi:hypothetical protein